MEKYNFKFCKTRHIRWEQEKYIERSQPDGQFDGKVYFDILTSTCFTKINKPIKYKYFELETVVVVKK